MASSTTEDWQMNKSLAETNRYALENQLYCDVKFVFQQSPARPQKEDNTISAHKYMLITRSPVFCAMFTGPAKDENPEVKIEDLEKETFLDMLKYIYTEQVEMTGYNVLAVMYCAKKYMIPGLEKLCRDFLEKNIDHTNVCFILEQAAVMGESALEEKCVTLLDEVAEEALMSEAFTKINLSTVERILKRDTLEIEEIDVYKACVAWAEAECGRQQIELTDENKRKMLGNSVFLIRFPIMKHDEFCKTVGSAKILSADEALDVVLHMTKSAPRNKLSFLQTEREANFMKWEECLFENAAYWSGKSFVGTIKQTFQTSNERVRISSIYFSNANGAQFESVQIQSGQHVWKSTTIAVCENRKLSGYPVLEVKFDPPVRVGPGTHTITFNANAGGKFCTSTLQGTNTLQHKNVTLSMGNSTWEFIYGFKLR